MAITLELIDKQELLKTLSDEQKKLIATLSANDENEVIGAKFSEVYRQLDDTIEKSTGIKRDGAEKTYKYLERATKEYASKYSDYDTIKTKVTTLEGEKKALEAKIAEGGDAALKGQLESVKKELESTKTTYAELKTKYDAEKDNHAKTILGIKVDAEIASANEAFQFKAGYSEAVINTLKMQATTKLKSMNPTFEGEEGKQRLVFHDANGVVMNNPDNALNPYSVKELLMKEYKSMDILEGEKPQGGAGGKGNLPKPSHTTASTQTEATESINKALLSEGYVKTDPKFHEEFNKRWDEMGADKLPME